MPETRGQDQTKQDSVEVIEHLGIQLWRAFHAWEAAFNERMVDAGYAWFAESRSGLLRHIPQEGLSQQQLAQRARITKQAVQQQVDSLEKDGVVTRNPDPNDARKKIIQYTALGLEAMEVANTIKRSIELSVLQNLEGDAQDTVAFLEALRRLPDSFDGLG